MVFATSPRTLIESAIHSLLNRRKRTARRGSQRHGPHFEVLEQRLLLSASATFATSALADYGPKPPALIMPLTAGMQQPAAFGSLPPRSRPIGTDAAQSVAIAYDPPYRSSAVIPFAPRPVANTGNIQASASNPQVDFVTAAIESNHNWSFVINGSNFGSGGSGSYVHIYDETKGFNAGRPGLFGDLVTLNYAGWSDNQIQVNGFGGWYTTYGPANPGDTLEFWVYNGQTGVLSSPVLYQLPNPTPTVPGEPSFSNYAPSSVTASWSGATDQAGLSIGYDYEVDGSTVGSTFSTSTSITGLSPSTNYSVAIRAFTYAGGQDWYSNWSSSNSFTTPSGKPTSPGTLTANGRTLTGATIDWTQSSAPSGQSITYTLEYAVHAFIDTGWIAVNTSSTSVLLSGLKPDTQYDLQLYAADSYGQSSTVDGSFSTVNPTPSTPGTPSATDVTPTSAVAAWAASSAPAGVAVTYNIQYKESGDLSWTSPSSLQGFNGTSCVLSNLTAGEQYFVRVQAVGTVNGQSYTNPQWSAQGEVTTPQWSYANFGPTANGSAPTSSDGGNTWVMFGSSGSIQSGQFCFAYQDATVDNGYTYGATVSVPGGGPQAAAGIVFTSGFTTVDSGGVSHEAPYLALYVTGSGAVAYSYFTGSGNAVTATVSATNQAGPIQLVISADGNGSVSLYYQPSPDVFAIPVHEINLGMFKNGFGISVGLLVSSGDSGTPISGPIVTSATFSGIRSGGVTNFFTQVSAGIGGTLNDLANTIWSGVTGVAGFAADPKSWLESKISSELQGASVSPAGFASGTQNSLVNAITGYSNNGETLAQQLEAMPADEGLAVSVSLEFSPPIPPPFAAALTLSATDTLQLVSQSGNEYLQFAGSFSIKFNAGIGLNLDPGLSPSVSVGPVPVSAPTAPSSLPTLASDSLTVEVGAEADINVGFFSADWQYALGDWQIFGSNGQNGLQVPNPPVASVSVDSPINGAPQSPPADNAIGFMLSLYAQATLNAQVDIPLTTPRAATSTKIQPTSAIYGYGAGASTLTADVTSSAGPVNEGDVNFHLVNSLGQTVGGTIAPAAISDGIATVSLPTDLAAGTYTVDATYTDGSGTKFAGSSDSGEPDLTVARAPLTIIADSQTILYGTQPDLIAGSQTLKYSGFVNGDSAASLATQPVLTATNTSANAGKYTSALQVGGASDPNYSISYTPGTLTISPATLTITALPQSIVYGNQANLTPSTQTIAYAGFVSGDSSANLSTLPKMTVASAATDAGTYTGDIVVGGAVDPNYVISYNPGTLTITPANLTITANNASIILGQSLPIFSVAYSGFVNGDTVASLSTQPTVTPLAYSDDAGSYTLQASGAADANYRITYASGVLTILKATPTITLPTPPATITYNGTTDVTDWVKPTLAGVSGGPAPTGSPILSYYSGSGAGGTLLTSSPVNPGTYTVVAKYAGDDNYLSAESNLVTFTISAARSAPVLLSAESVKTHGSAGTFGINLPLAGTPGVEDRIGGPTQLVLTFGNPITLGSGFAVSLSSGNVGSASVAGDTLTINLSGATDGQTLSVAVNDVEDTASGLSGNYALQVGVLYGDVDGDGVVNSNDINILRVDSGETVTSTNFQADVDASGFINSDDINIVRTLSGDSLAATTAAAPLRMIPASDVTAASNKPMSVLSSGSDIFVVNNQSGGIGEHTTSGATINAPLVTGLNRPAYIAVSAPNWQSLGPKNIPVPQDSGPLGAGKLQAFAVDLADPQIMYAGGGAGPGNSGPYAESGIFATTNGGASWTAADSGLTDPAVDGLWVDQTSPNIVLAGTWSGGMFRSTDAGASWTQISTPFDSTQTTTFLQVGQTIYATTAAGLAESSNAGSTWVLAEATSSPARALASSGTALYLGLDNGSVLFQASPSASWQTIFTDSGRTIWSIAADPSSPQTVYVVEWSNYTADLYRTQNGGENWTLLSPPGYNNAAQVVAIDGSGTLYAGIDGQLDVSSNQGASWTTLPGAAWDVRFLMPWPGQAGKMVVGSDQGLYLTSDGGSTWASLNGGISSSLLTGVAVSGSTILTAVQDYSPLASFDNGAAWQQFWGGGGSTGPIGEDGTVQFNPGNPNYAYAFTSAGFQLSTDGGHTFNWVTGAPPFTFAGGRNLIGVGASTPGTVYVAGNNGIYKSTNWGASFSKMSWSYNGTAFSDPSLVVVDPNNSQTIFVGLQNPAGLYVTHDGGSTWSICSLGGAAGNPIALAIDPSDTSIVEVGMTGTPQSGGGLFLSTDGGNTFAPDNAGLGSFQGTAPVYTSTIAFAPNSTTGQAAVATADGVYLSAAPGDGWTDASGNVVPKYFTDLQWDGSSLYAATYGEGVVVYSPSLPSPPALVSAESMKTQGSAGTFGINLPLTGTPGVEDRIGGPTQVAFTFQNPITTGANFAVGLSSGSVISTQVSGNTLTVNLSGATQGQMLTVNVNDVEDASNGASGNYSVQIGVLYGDVDGDGVVNSNDINILRVDSGETVTSTNFQADVDASGFINSNDINTARTLSGDTLTTPIVAIASASLVTTDASSLNSPDTGVSKTAAPTAEKSSMIPPTPGPNAPIYSGVLLTAATTTTTSLELAGAGSRITSVDSTADVVTVPLMIGQTLPVQPMPLLRIPTLLGPVSTEGGAKNPTSTEAAVSTSHSGLEHGNSSRYPIVFVIGQVYPTTTPAISPLMGNNLLQCNLVSINMGVPFKDTGLPQFGNWPLNIF